MRPTTELANKIRLVGLPYAPHPFLQPDTLYGVHEACAANTGILPPGRIYRLKGYGNVVPSDF